MANFTIPASSVSGLIQLGLGALGPEPSDMLGTVEPDRWRPKSESLAFPREEGEIMQHVHAVYVDTEDVFVVQMISKFRYVAKDGNQTNDLTDRLGEGLSR